MTAFVLLLQLLLLCIACHGQNEREATVGYGGMVASAHHLATKAGINVLKNCGSAADAAVAIQAVLTVVQPHKSGIGGGKFIMYYNYSNKQIYSLDAREEAPERFHGKIYCKNPDCFTNSSCQCDGGTMNFTERRVGGLSVGVPGTIHGLYTLQKYFGSGAVKWKELFTEAIDFARNGFPMYQELYRDINDSADILSRFQATKEIFLNDNNEPIVNVNETWSVPDLADTLEATSIDPETAINLWYNGAIADAILQTAQNAENEVDYNDDTTYRHGLLTKDDISNYRAVFREPSQSYYGNDENPEYRMYGMNYPSSGSPSIQYLMNLMHSLINDEENPDSSTFANDTDIVYSGTNAHYLINGNNVVFADRNQYMADMDFVDVPADGLLNYQYINNRYKEFFSPQLNANNTPPIPFGTPPGFEENTSQNNFGSNIEFGTSHYFVVDQWHNMACVTTTIEANFGSGVVVPGYGFLLNNELTDFDILGETSEGDTVANGPEGGKKLRRTALNLFDLNDNETVGGKRPRSSMGPMIVLDAETDIPVLGVGSPGGSTIIATVFQILFNALIRDIDVQIAIDLPRVWASNSATSIMIEPEWYYNNPTFVVEMGLRGYDMTNSGPFYNGTQGRCHAVRYVQRDDGIDGFWLYGGADDSRWSTAQVLPVFVYNELGDNNDVIVCPMRGIEVKTLTDEERIALIVVWLIVLVFVCFCVVCRSRITKWYDSRKRDGYAEFGNESEEQTEIEQVKVAVDNSERL